MCNITATLIGYKLSSSPLSNPWHSGITALPEPVLCLRGGTQQRERAAGGPAPAASPGHAQRQEEGGHGQIHHCSGWRRRMYIFTLVLCYSFVITAVLFSYYCFKYALSEQITFKPCLQRIFSWISTRFQRRKVLSRAYLHMWLVG